MVRFRTVGDITCTAPVESNADTVKKNNIRNSININLRKEVLHVLMIKSPNHPWN